MADIVIDAHYKNNCNDVHTLLKANPEIINEDYQQNDKLCAIKNAKQYI
ncbi:MAG: hypothetical protein ACR5K2_03660 [Wolbachia sp.]